MGRCKGDKLSMKDVGFGMTVQDKNAPDLVPLYKISDEMGMEFATASLHNSFYFVEAKNIIHDRPMVVMPCSLHQVSTFISAGRFLQSWICAAHCCNRTCSATKLV